MISKDNLLYLHCSFFTREFFKSSLTQQCYIEIVVTLRFKLLNKSERIKIKTNISPEQNYKRLGIIRLTLFN